MNLFWQITVVEALLNVAIFVVAVIAYGVLQSRAMALGWSDRLEQTAVGALLGGATALATLVPLHLDGGAAVGCQSVLIALSGPISGGLSTLVALIISEVTVAASTHLLEGGSAAIDAGSFAAAALAAALFRLIDRRTPGSAFRRRWVQLAFLAVVSSIGSLAALAVLTGLETAFKSALAATASGIVATFVLGILLLHEKRRHEAEFDLRATAARLSETNDQLTRQTVELIHARDAAEQSSRAKSAFLANMSHELRTPLNAVIGFSQIIGQQTDPVHARCIDYAHDIQTGGEHLLGLISDILDFSKAEAGDLEIGDSEIPLNQTVDLCVRLMRPQAERNAVTLRLAEMAAGYCLRGDERRIRQIVLNLLSNAIKFTPAGGNIDVAVGPAVDGGLVIEVRDDGIGISEADRGRVFEPFFQADSELSRLREGTGLGLPLTKRLVELHDSRLELESALGTGTVVRVVFPVQRVRADSGGA